MSGNWPVVPLADVLTERREQPLPAALAAGEVKVVAKIGFNTGTIELRSDGETKTGMILILPGDLVVSGINATKGAVAIYGQDATEPIAATIHYGAYIPDETRVDVRFLWMLLRSDTFRGILTHHLPGGVKTELKARRFLPIPIPLPPLPEQRRIVAKLDAIAAKVEDARGLRSAAGHAADGLSAATARLAFTHIPCASTVPLGELCSEVLDCPHSNPVYADTGVPVVRSPDVGWGRLLLSAPRCTSEEEYARRTNRGEPRTGDIVLVREGGGTGKAGMVEPGHRFSLGQRVMLLRPDQAKVLPQFLLRQWLSPIVYEDQVLEQAKGSASPHLNVGAVRRLRFRLPALPEQRHIVARLDALQAKVDRLNQLQAKTAADLDALMPSVLDRAFKGDL